MSLLSDARGVAKLLEQTGHKVVFAESCTAGLVAASLSRIPGISAWHCGGMVTYRNETKTAYLGISSKVLKRPGPVSAQVARQMAESVLSKTPEATVAASITGHLGPNAPARLDGVVYVAVSRRSNQAPSAFTTTTFKFTLSPEFDRYDRQKLAAEMVLTLLGNVLAESKRT
jgi:nicotinamide-nucleotide amidase